MEYKYVCKRCGKTFTKESERRIYSLMYCPECRKLRKYESNAEWRQRQREKAFGTMRKKYGTK